jgi:hypothetical protein
MTYQDALKDYIEVKDRVQEFKKLYPSGSLQFTFHGQIEIAGQILIWGQAFAYRDQEDLRPGVGTAWELVPGKSPFVRGSEISVLETSCWGRALAALAIATSKSISTKDEISAAQQRDPWATPTDSPTKPVEGNLSALGAKVVETYTEQPKQPIKGLTGVRKAGLASTKQVNYLRVIFGKGWTAAGYSPDPTEEDFISWFNYHSKENYQSRAQFENLPVGEALDSQSNIVESIMSWNKDGQLWKSEAF